MLSTAERHNRATGSGGEGHSAVDNTPSPLLERHFDSDARTLADVQTSIYLIRK